MITGDLTQTVLIAGIGLAAGLLGGLTGLGGSLIMLPGMALLIGFSDPSHPEQHLYQAAAMAVNFFVAVPATWRHARAGKVRAPILVRLLPTACVAIVLGALVSDRIQGDLLVRLLGGIIVLMVILSEVVHHLRKTDHDEPETPDLVRRATPAIVGTGVATGFLGGLLGIGGGVITVVSLQTLGQIRVRQAIAASSAAMCLMSPIGSAAKMLTLRSHGQSAIDAVQLVGMLAPAAVVGSLAGASLVHKLPSKVVRPAVSFVLLLAAARLLGIF